MPKEFDNCVKAGGRVRTKTLKGDKYLHICFPKGGGPGIAGEVKSKGDVNAPTGKVYKRGK